MSGYNMLLLSVLL